MSKIKGTKGNDDLRGTAADDIIFGRGGNDTIKAGAGDDIVNVNGKHHGSTIGLGAGDDLVNIGPKSSGGMQNINGGKGVDTANFSGPITFEKGEDGNITVTDTNGTHYTLRGIENITVNGVSQTITTTHDAPLSAAATDDDGTLLNNGVPGERFNLVADAISGVTMGLAAHQYGDVYDYNYVSNSTYVVQSGSSDINPARADWNFAMSAEGDLTGYNVGVYFDMDPGKGEDFVFIGNLEDTPDSATSNPDIVQNSWNMNFDFIASHLPEGYSIEDAAEFGIEMRLQRDGETSAIAVNHIDVLVM